jgi:hypothetical protein
MKRNLRFQKNQANNIYPFITTCLLFLWMLTGVNQAYGQNCSVNAGVPETICVDEQLFLYGNYSGSVVPGEYSNSGFTVGLHKVIENINQPKQQL